MSRILFLGVVCGYVLACGGAGGGGTGSDAALDSGPDVAADLLEGGDSPLEADAPAGSDVATDADLPTETEIVADLPEGGDNPLEADAPAGSDVATDADLPLETEVVADVPPEVETGKIWQQAMTAAAGGVLQTPSGSAKLTVPPGALPSDTILTVQVLPATAETASPVFDFGPSGLAFNGPVTLDLAFQGPVPEGQHAMIAIHDWPSWHEYSDSVVAGNRVTAPVGHFTDFAVVFRSACVPNCAGRECGDDSCGASCGTCSEGEICDDGVCLGA